MVVLNTEDTPVLGWIDDHEWTDIENAFCITIYNEGAEEFVKTIRSVFVSIAHVDARPHRPPSRHIVCVIIDGGENANKEALASIADFGLLHPTNAIRSVETDFYLTRHSAEDFLSCLDGGETLRREGNIPNINIIICVKQHNRGKLHSHLLFFYHLCQKIQPMYCYQIDVGTLLAPQTVSLLVDEMACSPATVAIAPSVMPPAPAFHDKLIVAWQYLDFLEQKCIIWPFEAATGHLSVLPGQASILRWKALRGERIGNTSQPIHAYLRGLTATSPLERLMFLAEDRVIAIEMCMAREQHWHLDYVPEAEAITDSCAKWGELFRQRRRWINSMIACRLWLFGMWPDFMRRTDRSVSSKLAFCGAMIAQSFAIFQMFFAPVRFLSFAVIVMKLLTFSHFSVKTATLLMLFVYLILNHVSDRLGARRPIVIAMHEAIAIALNAIVIGSIIIWFPLSVCLVLLLPAAIFHFLVFVRSPSSIRVIARIPVFPLIGMWMDSLLSSYALWKLDDVSWGTKGLVHARQSLKSDARLKRWKKRTVAVWVILNGIALLGLGANGMILPSLNPVVEIDALMRGVMTGIAFLHFVLSKVFFRRRFGRPDILPCESDRGCFPRGRSPFRHRDVERRWNGIRAMSDARAA